VSCHVVEAKPLVEDDILVVETPPASHRFLAGVRALIADDDRDCRELFRLVLETSGATVVTAGRTREALSEFLRVQPHVVVSELSLRDEDGYWLVRRVRASIARGDRRLFVVAVTVDDDPHTRQRAIEAGFDAVLTKPVDPWEFCGVVRRLAAVAGII